MSASPCLAVILAAGKGTRMKSDLPKVMHPLAGAPLIAHVLEAVREAEIGRVCAVVGPEMQSVGEAVKAVVPAAEIAVQEQQLGTADAVKAAGSAFAKQDGPVIVIYGDTPLLGAETLVALRDALEAGADLAVIGFEADNPTGYGRLLIDKSGALTGIREEKDADEAERALTLCNSGIMGFRSGEVLATLLARIGNHNAKGEYYLTDAVSLARASGLQAKMLRAEMRDVLGVNSRGELAEAEAAIQTRLRSKFMADGATLIAPETVFFCHDTKIGRDVVIEPNVVFGPGVVIGDGVTIRGFATLPAPASKRGRRSGRSRGCGLAPRSERVRISAISSRSNNRTSPRARRSIISLMSAMRVSARTPISALAPSPAIMTASPSTGRRSAPAPSSARTVRWWRR